MEASEARVNQQLQEADTKLEEFKYEQVAEMQGLRDETKAELAASEQHVAKAIQEVTETVEAARVASEEARAGGSPTSGGTRPEVSDAAAARAADPC